MTKEEKRLEKEKLKAEANLKRNGPAGFAKNFIATQFVIMYLVISITDIFSLMDIDYARYIGVFIVGLLTAFFSIKKCFSLCTKEEYSNIKKLSHVYIGVVALVIVIWGLYSVTTNVKENRETFEELKAEQQEVIEAMEELEKAGYDIKDFATEEDLANIEMALNLDIDAEIEKAKKEAQLHWFITAVLYAVAAEIALFLAGKKVSIDSLPDSREDATPEKVFESTELDNTLSESDINPTIEEKVSEDSAIKEKTQDIKFDL